MTEKKYTSKKRPGSALSWLLKSICIASALCACLAMGACSGAASDSQDASSAASTGDSTAASTSSQAESTADKKAAKTSDKASTKKSTEASTADAQKQSTEASTSTAASTEEKESSSKSDSNSSSKKSKTKRVWVDPVYKKVHHKEVGHYETVMVDVQKVKCRCGEIFDSIDEWQAHQDAYVEQMRIEKNDPNYTCDGTHGTSHYVTIQVPEKKWVVDKKAYTEKVLVKEGYWKYE